MTTEAAEPTSLISPTDPTAVVSPDTQARFDHYYRRIAQAAAGSARYTIILGQVLREAREEFTASGLWNLFVSPLPYTPKTIAMYLAVGSPEVAEWYLSALEDEELAPKLSSSPYTLAEFARLEPDKRRPAIEANPAAGAAQAKAAVKKILTPLPPPRPAPPVVSTNPDVDPDAAAAVEADAHHGNGDYRGAQGGQPGNEEPDKLGAPTPDPIVARIETAVGGPIEQPDQQELPSSPRELATQALAALEPEEAIAVVAVWFETLEPDQRMAFLTVTGCMDMFRSKLFGRRQRAS